MSDEPTMRDTLAADLEELRGGAYDYWLTEADALLARGWRKVPDFDAAVKMVWDALGALPGVPMFPGELADAAGAAVDALFGETAP